MREDCFAGRFREGGGGKGVFARAAEVGGAVEKRWARIVPQWHFHTNRRHLLVLYGGLGSWWSGVFNYS